jgi:ATP-dependent helicase IRC3
MALGDTTLAGEPDRKFYREYDLALARENKESRNPEIHQNRSLEKLHRWYDSRPFPEAGGILVLPTGAGKTFCAIRFLCCGPLSDGYKVLWLAHTHHLLEQAFDSFEHEVGKISEPRRSLKVRVVSGTPGHSSVHQINPGDNVVIATLQTICRAHADQHEALQGFLRESAGRLFVIFDEAHHSPAPSYRRLIVDLRQSYAEMYLLGLTATPTYTDQSKKGWLRKLFPQNILHQESPQALMAAGILAKPICEEPQTNITPVFNEHDYQQWVGTYRDLPEDVIERLALNKKRNKIIADRYSQNRDKYGKTIIFADRWEQCEQISEFLLKSGISTGTVYSKRPAVENRRTIEAFRNKQIDVLLNIKMLTEGTDVPHINSVFLTRQTTSSILLTQMVGRALRGPKFGGTKEANIVSFIDNWKQLINWAGYDQLAEGMADENIPEYGKRPPLKEISIELVQRLARQMHSGPNINPVPFLRLLPIGWYRVQYNVQIPDRDEQQVVRQLIMVFDQEQNAFRSLIERLMGEESNGLEREDVHLDEVSDRVNAWRDRFFPDREHHYGTSLEKDIFAIARHVAQEGAAPVFFEWEDKDKHDLDLIAQEHIDQNLGTNTCDERLLTEYGRTDRFWISLYYTYDWFKSSYDACVNRLRNARKQPGAPPAEDLSVIITPEEAHEAETVPEVESNVQELSEKIRPQVIEPPRATPPPSPPHASAVSTSSAGRKRNAIFEDAIMHVLQSGPLETRHICSEVQRLHPELCDDDIWIKNGSSYEKKWVHDVRNAQQPLKKKQIIERLEGGKWGLTVFGRTLV